MRGFLFGALMLSAVPSFALAGGQSIFYYSDPQEFHAANISDGKNLKGVEDFEEAQIVQAGKQALPDPLVYGVPNMGSVGGFPEGLAQPNLRIQANTFPGPTPLTLNPSGAPDALYLVGAGFVGANSNKVGEDLGVLHGIVASYDLIFLDQNKTGIGFDLSRFDHFNPQVGFVISVFSTTNQLLGVYNLPSSGFEPIKKFWGVWSATPIGRINIFDDDISVPGQPIFSPSAVDNIEMWVPEPTSAALLLVGAAWLRRRR